MSERVNFSKEGLLMNLIWVAGAAGAAIGFTAGDKLSAEERIEIVPTCQQSLDKNEALLPLDSEQVTRTMGQVAVCKVGDEVFSIQSFSK